MLITHPAQVVWKGTPKAEKKKKKNSRHIVQCCKRSMGVTLVSLLFFFPVVYIIARR